MSNITTGITAALEITDAGSEFGGQYMSVYAIAIYADGVQIGRVGDVVAAVEGWAIGAWLAPGAHQDIDDSGLPCWGDSQPGGWSTADGDGACYGRPRVSDDGDGDGAAPIVITAGEGQLDVRVYPSDVPEWRTAVAELERLTAANEANPEDDAVASAADIRAAIVKALVEAIDSAADGMAPQEPSAEDILATLSGDELHGIEWGNYHGAGPVIAWRDADGHAQFRWWPDARDVRDAIDDALAPSLVAQILADLADDS